MIRYLISIFSLKNIASIFTYFFSKLIWILALYVYNYKNYYLKIYYISDIWNIAMQVGIVSVLICRDPSLPWYKAIFTGCLFHSLCPCIAATVALYITCNRTHFGFPHPDETLSLSPHVQHHAMSSMQAPRGMLLPPCSSMQVLREMLLSVRLLLLGMLRTKWY